jgi:hypothetical protein
MAVRRCETLGGLGPQVHRPGLPCRQGWQGRSGTLTSAPAPPLGALLFGATSPLPNLPAATKVARSNHDSDSSQHAFAVPICDERVDATRKGVDPPGIVGFGRVAG